LILRCCRRQQQDHPAELLARGKAASLLAQTYKAVGTAVFNRDAFCASNRFGYTRLSDCHVAGYQTNGHADSFYEDSRTVVSVHEGLP
jgi:hypothetical protein